MARVPFACLLIALCGSADSADESKPGPARSVQGQPASTETDAVRELKQQLEELKKQQAELAKKIDATADKLKRAEEKATGTARLTVTGVLEQGEKDGLYSVGVLGPGSRERKVYMADGEQVKLLAKIVGRRVTITGDLVVNTADPHHHDALNVTLRVYHGVPAGEIGVVNFTADLAADPKSSGK
jgi:hypothetical protein